ncbi:hypothetical protein P8X24_02045 [Pyrococcus kukulkanii]|uniref:hypothetical protein n=1 Tax=Pyrococcus kukulkanii TaxID=1609559 RepID=UPI0035625E0E
MIKPLIFPGDTNPGVNMGYYEEIPGFEYWNVEAWKKYIRDYIGPIYSTTKTLLELKDYLERYVGKSLKAVKEDDERVLKFFVGGINESGNYTERSLAKLIRLMYGIYVEPTEFISAIEAVGEEGLSDILVKKEKEDNVSFLKMIKALNKLSENALKKARVISGTGTSIEDILDYPNKLLDVLKDLYKAVTYFNAQYNPYTFFRLSTASLPWRYMIRAYQKLTKDVLEFLGIEPIFIPEVENEELREEYTIWGHIVGENSLGRYIYNIQLAIWAFMTPSLIGSKNSTLNVFNYVTNPEDFVKSYYGFAGVKSKSRTDVYVEIGSEKFYPLDTYRFEINGTLIQKWPNETAIRLVDGYSKAIIARSEHEKPPISLFKIIDIVSEFLFKGISVLLPEGENTIRYIGDVPYKAQWWF